MTMISLVCICPLNCWFIISPQSWQVCTGESQLYHSTVKVVLLGLSYLHVVLLLFIVRSCSISPKLKFRRNSLYVCVCNMYLWKELSLGFSCIPILDPLLFNFIFNHSSLVYKGLKPWKHSLRNPTNVISRPFLFCLSL